MTAGDGMNEGMEKTVAYAQARSVPGTFEVTNNLRVEKQGE